MWELCTCEAPLGPSICWCREQRLSVSGSGVANKYQWTKSHFLLDGDEKTYLHANQESLRNTCGVQCSLKLAPIRICSRNFNEPRSHRICSIVSPSASADEDFFRKSYTQLYLVSVSGLTTSRSFTFTSASGQTEATHTRVASVCSSAMKPCLCRGERRRDSRR